MGRSVHRDVTLASTMAMGVLDRWEHTDLAQTIFTRSVECWGEDRAVVLLGRSPAIVGAQQRLMQCTHTDGAALITGETGSGKELFARGLYLMSRRYGRPFVSINCAQYLDSQLLASELFGHTKGSFTGAIADRRSMFEEAQSGVIFLDEVAELSLAAQAMLLRVLGEGEIVRVGENRPRRVDVRTVAATAVDLEQAAARRGFREDLFYRLRGVRLRIPPLRERDDDWRVIADYALHALNTRYSVVKRFSAASLRILEGYSWPGNIRELKSIVEQGFYMSRGQLIEPADFAADLNLDASGDTAGASTSADVRHDEGGDVTPTQAEHLYARIRRWGLTFWDAVHRPYLNRELNRREVQAILAAGLRETQGSYKRLLPLIGLDATEYVRFMDFLRHHALKPPRRDVASGSPDCMLTERRP
ncbi:MAG: sigma 54-interacting transcriptional regulator [Vicinamibacterales bacterium]